MANVMSDEDITVVLGTAWNGKFGLDEDDVIVLQNNGTESLWSEDGTDVMDESTNRILVQLRNEINQDYVYLYVIHNNITTPTLYYTAVLGVFRANSGDDGNYNFKDVFDTTLTSSSTRITASYTNAAMDAFTGYTPAVFKSMVQASDPEPPPSNALTLNLPLQRVRTITKPRVPRI